MHIREFWPTRSCLDYFIHVQEVFPEVLLEVLGQLPTLSTSSNVMPEDGITFDARSLDADALKSVINYCTNGTLIKQVTANLTGSKYNIWDQKHCPNSKSKSNQPNSKQPLAVIDLRLQPTTGFSSEKPVTLPGSATSSVSRMFHGLKSNMEYRSLVLPGTFEIRNSINALAPRPPSLNPTFPFKNPVRNPFESINANSTIVSHGLNRPFPIHEQSNGTSFELSRPLKNSIQLGTDPSSTAVHVILLNSGNTNFSKALQKIVARFLWANFSSYKIELLRRSADICGKVTLLSNLQLS
ncbi:hypothetical protein KIW84_011350 [Lathyrus oleraceus]|uniref:Uncharacterized protein n=1 Tax=Pisum sativum TaxID=3888 RepID=A0A9D4YP21_PEA|nr:hypothetical protein KIW84_011350 [Pisum sativum]